MKAGERPPIPDPYVVPTPARAPNLPPLPRPTSPYATWAIVVGMLAVVCVGPGPVLGLVAIVLGLLAHGEITRSAGQLGGRGLAIAGMTMGTLSFAVFAAIIGLYFHYRKPAPPEPTAAATVASAATAAPAAPAPAPDPSASATPPAPAASSESPPATVSTITTVGAITLVDVAAGVPSLSTELKNQRTAAAAHGEKLVVQTLRAGCEPCDGVASALGDPLMQKALSRVRLVRVDVRQFDDDLEELAIPADRIPGFFLLDSDLRVVDAIDGGEWDDDVAGNIAPVLGPFVRGTYTKRRTPRPSPRPSGTAM